MHRAKGWDGLAYHFVITNGHGGPDGALQIIPRWWAQKHGAHAIFLVDNNIILNLPRFEALCEAILRAGLNHLDYYVQAMTSAIATHGARLAPLMRRAGFRYVFLGIENMEEQNLKFLRATAKNTQRHGGVAAGNATLKAIELLHRNGMYVVGGLIVGNPDDTAVSIQSNPKLAARFVDWPYIHALPGLADDTGVPQAGFDRA